MHIWTGIVFAPCTNHALGRRKPAGGRQLRRAARHRGMAERLVWSRSHLHVSGSMRAALNVEQCFPKALSFLVKTGLTWRHFDVIFSLYAECVYFPLSMLQNWCGRRYIKIVGDTCQTSRNIPGWRMGPFLFHNKVGAEYNYSFIYVTFPSVTLSTLLHLSQ